jgi:hypothetical protein
MGAVEFWEDRYGSKEQVWSGRVNRVLVDVASDLLPGRALDLGCGEGGDAIWLAQRGWQVTAMDISTIAVERGRTAALATGVPADRITWVAQDLADWTPSATFDLVSAFFLHSPVELPREEILRRAASAVAPGGHLLVVAHAAPPPWWTPDQHEHAHEALPTPEEELASLRLAAGEWDVVIAEARLRPTTDPEGKPVEILDGVVLVRRRLPEGERDVASELRALEPIFHRSPAGSTREHFEAMTVPDYWEVGASGRPYEREFVLATVTERHHTGAADGPLDVTDFAVRRLDGDAWLVTYDLDQDGRRSRRSTIWLDTPGGWVAVYHQGTLT